MAQKNKGIKRVMFFVIYNFVFLIDPLDKKIKKIKKIENGIRDSITKEKVKRRREVNKKIIFLSVTQFK